MNLHTIRLLKPLKLGDPIAAGRSVGNFRHPPVAVAPSVGPRHHDVTCQTRTPAAQEPTAQKTSAARVPQTTRAELMRLIMLLGRSSLSIMISKIVFG